MSPRLGCQAAVSRQGRGVLRPCELLVDESAVTTVDGGWHVSEGVELEPARYGTANLAFSCQPQCAGA